MRSNKVYPTPEDHEIASRQSIHAAVNYIVGDHRDAEVMRDCEIDREEGRMSVMWDRNRKILQAGLA